MVYRGAAGRHTHFGALTLGYFASSILPPTVVPVHPTQIYESGALAIAAWALLRWRRAGVADRVVLGRYFMLAGSIRFIVEFVRINLPIVGPLTLAQLLSASLAAVGLWLAMRTPRPRLRAA